MNYKGNQHLKWEDRLSLERMLKIKTPKPKIAEALGVCLKTVYNEIARGMCEQLALVRGRCRTEVSRAFAGKGAGH